MTGRLGDDELAEALEGGSWRRDGETIVREIECDDFRAAMARANQVAGLAEAANHHPDILVHDYKHLRLTLSTHSEGGVTAADLELAARVDDLP